MPVGGPAPLLITQVAMPAPPAGIVPRPRLAQLLRDGIDGFTTLVCAPAGSGKTSLLTAELGRDGLPQAAWVSLGVGDDEPGRFWGTVLAALRVAGVVPEGSALDALAPPVRESRRGFMPLLVNALAELDGPVVLVLDDLHSSARASASRSSPSCSCTPRRRCASSSAPAQTLRCRCTSCASVGSSSRSASPTWRSPRTRPRRCWRRTASR